MTTSTPPHTVVQATCHICRQPAQPLDPTGRLDDHDNPAIPTVLFGYWCMGSGEWPEVGNGEGTS